MNGEELETGPAIKWSPSTRDSPKDRRYPVENLPSDERVREEASSWAQLCPLIAATLGPLAVLLGIPSLTQPWHGIVLVPPLLPNGWSNFQTLPDPPLNVALAAVTLFCEVMGNVFLILRFSDFHAKATTWLSYGFWILKIILGVANYIQFGIAHPETEDIIYLEGYWVYHH